MSLQIKYFSANQEATIIIGVESNKRFRQFVTTFILERPNRKGQVSIINISNDPLTILIWVPRTTLTSFQFWGVDLLGQHPLNLVSFLLSICRFSIFMMWTILFENGKTFAKNYSALFISHTGNSHGARTDYNNYGLFMQNTISHLIHIHVCITWRVG